MLKYILLRVLLFIPTFFLLCIFAFVLHRASPGDPVENLLEIRGVTRGGDVIFVNYEREYRSLSNEMGYDKPNFYFSVVPHYFPDTLYKIWNPRTRAKARALLKQHQDWRQIREYLLKEQLFIDNLNPAQDSQRMIFNDVALILDDISNEINIDLISGKFDELQKYVQHNYLWKDTDLISKFRECLNRLESQKQNRILLPKLLWHGRDNQFQYWMGRLVRGDFGYSMVDGRSVWKKISKAMLWTIAMVLLAIFLSFLLAIPIGVFSAKYKDSFFDKLTSLVLYLIYGIPLFWLATLGLVFLTTSEYGQWTDIFPSTDFEIFGSDESQFSKMLANSQRLILPVICLSLHSLAYLSRQTRMGMLSEIHRQYTLTALSKGLGFNRVLWRHNFPNTLLPLITILFGSIPAALVGSLVIEVIFNIPGMGRLMYSSIFNDDWPVLFSSLVLFGLGTMLSYLAGDVVYSLVNPKIKFGNQ